MKTPRFVLFTATDSKGNCHFQQLVRTNVDAARGDAYLKRFCQRALDKKLERGKPGDLTVTADYGTGVAVDDDNLISLIGAKKGDKIGNLSMLDLAIVQTRIEHEAAVLRLKYAAHAL